MNGRGGLVVATIVAILVAHQAAVLAHEYAHSLMAVALGDKSDPLAIHFGSLSPANLLLLREIDENVDYGALFAQGGGAAAALIGFAGPGLANGSLYIVSLFSLQQRVVWRSTFLFLVVFWFNFMNLGNIYAYVPIRTFASNGDIGHITQGLGMAPGVALVVFGVPTAAALWWFFTRTLPLGLVRLAAGAPSRQAEIVVLSVCLMFGGFGLAGVRGYGMVSHVLSLASLCSVPLVLIFCWPTRSWMQARMAKAPRAAADRRA